MKRLVDFISDPRNQIRWWATWTVVWVALDPVSMVTGLQNRVWWISQMSDFANFASCGTALVAAWSYFRARNVDEKVDSSAHFRLIENVEQELVRQGRDHGAALAELLDMVRQAPLPRPVQQPPGLVVPAGPASDAISAG